MSEARPYLDKYPNLFKPMEVGKKKVLFKNRIFTAPMHGIQTIDPDSNFLSNDGIEFFGQKARGGAGCVHLGEAQMDHKNSAAHDAHYDLTNERILQSLHKFNEYAHAYGARTSIEFNHNGHFALPEYCNGMQPMSASARLMPNGNLVLEMNEDDMNYVADIYAERASMAKRGGFDMVCLHYGHGWLFGGWMSDLLNQRKDKYGGSLENKIRFPRMVIERIREKCGDEILIEVRLSGSEFTPGGTEMEDNVEYIKMLEDVIDLVHISCGTRFNAYSRADMHPSHFIAHGHNADRAAMAKKAGVKIPVGVVGAIGIPELAEQILAEGKADYVMMGRAWVADTDWAEKVRTGHEEDIRPCIKCNHCIDSGNRVAISTAVLQDFTATRKAECSVNPLHGPAGYKANLPPAAEKKRIVVIGGGVAGMQAAMNAAERGHEVTLYEKNLELGGQLFYTDYVWFKKDMRRFREYLKTQVRKKGVNVKLGVEATAESIKTDRPDAVIVAVGAEPIIPPISGIDQKNVLGALDVFGHEDKVGQKVVIIGGGLVGCEMSIHLGDMGKEVTVVEMGQYLAPDAQLSERLHTLKYMDRAKVVSYTDTKCQSITDKAVHAVDKDGKEYTLAADTVILCTGMRSRKEVAEQFADSAFDVIYIGDCKKVANVKNAVHTGFNAAIIL